MPTSEIERIEALERRMAKAEEIRETHSWDIFKVVVGTVLLCAMFGAFRQRKVEHTIIMPSGQGFTSV
jgi:hypothetical protein